LILCLQAAILVLDLMRKFKEGRGCWHGIWAIEYRYRGNKINMPLPSWLHNIQFAIRSCAEMQIADLRTEQNRAES